MADTKHIVYKFVYLNEIIYIGKSDVGFERIFSHDGSMHDNINADSPEEVQNALVYYAEMANATMADVYESELIRRYKPKYNKSKTSDWSGIPLPEPTWTMFRDYSDKRFEALKRKLESMTRKYEAEHQKYLEEHYRAETLWGKGLNRDAELYELRKRVKRLEKEIKKQKTAENLRVKIQALAKKKGITLGELEERAGVPKGAISHWCGTPRSVKTAAKIAEILEVTIDELIPEEVK